MEIIKIENKDLISAKELHAELGIKKAFSTWIKLSIERADLEQDKDFFTYMEESTGGRPTTDYLLVRDAALSVIMMSGGQFASKLRKTVIELYNQHNTGLAFSAVQIEALIDLSKAMTLISIQKEVERKHFDVYNNSKKWYGYRAALLGYGKEEVIEAMNSINKRYQSIRKSLVKLDSNELIRTGVIDFMRAMGKTEEYSTNVGNLCKTMALKMDLGNIIWDDTKENPLNINASSISERKENYDNSKKMLN